MKKDTNNEIDEILVFNSSAIFANLAMVFGAVAAMTVGGSSGYVDSLESTLVYGMIGGVSGIFVGSHIGQRIGTYISTSKQNIQRFRPTVI